jgi:cytochrome P450
VIRLTTYADARDAFRSKELRQALYDEGDRLMHGVVVNLHGAEHLARRRLENRLFRRDTFAWYEAEVIPGIIARVLEPALAAGCGDLLPLARRTMLTLSLGVAGVDLHRGDDDEIDELYALMDRLARASTVAHATGDKSAIVDDGDLALEEFDRRWFEGSLRRREALARAFDHGALAEEELPRDVLMTLVRNQDRLELPPEVVLREVAYFPWVGSHSTSNQFVHAMHHIFEWLADHPADRARLTEDAVERQRFVHESLRLHPASPVTARHALADVPLRSGAVLPAGSEVAIDMVAVNRDPAVFGEDADRFDPHRSLPDDVAPWGMSFGHGVHACLGQELAGGLVFHPEDPLAAHLLGSVAVMAGVVLAAGARPDPEDPPELDTSTTREVFGRYPVRFAPR